MDRVLRLRKKVPNAPLSKAQRGAPVTISQKSPETSAQGRQQLESHSDQEEKPGHNWLLVKGNGHVYQRLKEPGRVTPDRLHELRNLIRTKYQLDTEIWSLRGVLNADKYLVQQKMELADNILRRIFSEIESWNEDSWAPHEWKLAQSIRDRVFKDGKRWWRDHPPWDEYLGPPRKKVAASTATDSAYNFDEDNQHSYELNEAKISTQNFSITGFPDSCAAPLPSVPSLTEGTTKASSSTGTSKDPDDMLIDPLSNTKKQSLEEISALTSEGSDIFSMASVADDINSTYAGSTTAETRIAEVHLSTRLLRHQQFRLLCEKALSKMSADRFVENIRRLLKRYYLDLLQHCESPLEAATVRILRSRYARTRIASSVARRARPLTDQVKLQIEEEDRDMIFKTTDLEKWIQEVYPTHANPVIKSSPETLLTAPESFIPETVLYSGDFDHDLADSNADSDTETDISIAGDIHDSLRPLPNVMRLENFLLEGVPFHCLLVHLQEFVHPSPSSALVRVLMSIPTQDIDFVTSYQVTMWDKLRLTIEGWTHEQWNWWPLSSPLPELLSGYTRVKWKCYCDESVWYDVGDSEIDNLRTTLALRGGWTDDNHLCKRTHTETPKHPAHPTAGEPDSDPAKTASPPSDQSTRLGGSANATNPTTPSFSGSSQASASDISAKSRKPHDQSIDLSSQSSAYVLMGVDDSTGSLEIAHLDMAKVRSDGDFFALIMEKYIQMRHWWRKYASVWQFNHCRFVKFEKWRANEVRSDGESVPLQTDHEYDPRAPVAQPPVISIHEFEKSLYPCTDRCRLAWLSRLSTHLVRHRCLDPSDDNTAIQRVPKKRSEWLLQNKGRDHAWGLEACYRPSAWRIIVYHFLILTPSLVFMIRWILGSPSDLQDASVPIMLQLGMLSLFWSLFGAWQSPAIREKIS